MKHCTRRTVWGCYRPSSNWDTYNDIDINSPWSMIYSNPYLALIKIPTGQSLSGRNATDTATLTWGLVVAQSFTTLDKSFLFPPPGAHQAWHHHALQNPKHIALWYSRSFPHPHFWDGKLQQDNWAQQEKGAKEQKRAVKPLHKEEGECGFIVVGKKKKTTRDEGWTCHRIKCNIFPIVGLNG